MFFKFEKVEISVFFSAQRHRQIWHINQDNCFGSSHELKLIVKIFLFWGVKAQNLGGLFKHKMILLYYVSDRSRDGA